MLPREVETTVQFPRLPLAKTVIRIAIELQHNPDPAQGGVAKSLTGMKQQWRMRGASAQQS
jgi:hypothetical protein